MQHGILTFDAFTSAMASFLSLLPIHPWHLPPSMFDDSAIFSHLLLVNHIHD